ncbi:MAG: hypothetical protein RL722_583 [Pseudomonadota bacterium]|jgi:hypothetical protein
MTAALHLPSRPALPALPCQAPGRGRPGLLAATCLALSLLTPTARAHELGDDPLPATPGVRLGAAAVFSSIWSDVTLPVRRWPGQPGSGQVPSERTGLGLEHGTLDAAWRLSGGEGSEGLGQGGVLALGRHGQDPAHVEAAWWRLEQGRRDGPLAGRLSLQLGRDRLPLGEPLRNAGHFDRYAQAPLIKRLVLNDDLMPDGLNLAWRRADDHARGTRLTGVDLGVWQVRGWPGSRNGQLAPVLHLQGADNLPSLGGLRLTADAFVASLHPQGRGMVAASSSAAHTHAAPDCRTSLTGVVCFDGRTRLLGGSLQASLGRWQFELAALSQADQGSLYSRRGAASYQGRQQGGWLQAAYRIHPAWEASARAERSVARHSLIGPSADLVAADGGLLPNRPITRLAAQVDWQPMDGLTLYAETGTEGNGSGPAAVKDHWLGLRLKINWPGSVLKP